MDMIEICLFIHRIKLCADKKQATAANCNGTQTKVASDRKGQKRPFPIE